eukprot:8580509-Pyramimonas_sp.AAC.1
MSVPTGPPSGSSPDRAGYLVHVPLDRGGDRPQRSSSLDSPASLAMFIPASLACHMQCISRRALGS